MKLNLVYFSFSLLTAKLLSCRHTDEMIHKLESAGLGYRVKTDESEDRLGMKLQKLVSPLRTTSVRNASN